MHLRRFVVPPMPGSPIRVALRLASPSAYAASEHRHTLPSFDEQTVEVSRPPLSDRRLTSIAISASCAPV
jgi:hypothetical protein